MNRRRIIQSVLVVTVVGIVWTLVSTDSSLEQTKLNRGIAASPDSNGSGLSASLVERGGIADQELSFVEASNQGIDLPRAKTQSCRSSASWIEGTAGDSRG